MKTKKIRNFFLIGSGMLSLSCSFRDLTPTEIYRKNKDGIVMIETSNGIVYPAIVAKYSDNPDLAWILIIPFNCLTAPPEDWIYPPPGSFLEIDHTYRPETGEEVIAIGNPFGFKRSIFISAGRSDS